MMINNTKKIKAISFVVVATISVSACSGNEKGKSEGSEKTSNNVDISTTEQVPGGFEGVSSDNRSYPLSDNSDSAEAVSEASEGTGETTKMLRAESAEETERLLSLPPITADGVFNAESIIDPDNRIKVSDTTKFPQRVQVLIALPRGRCSGVMVSKDLVLTAGHCVHSGGKNGDWMASATVYPGRNGSSSPFGSCMAKRFYSVKGWTENHNSNYDFGAIKLNCDIGNRVGWLGFFFKPQSLNGLPAAISSYPGDKPLEQWVHTGAVQQSNDLKSYYNTDTMPGNSGSGVFASTGVPTGCGGPCVHTVHAYGTGQGVSLNSGTRISRPLFDNLLKWKNEN